MKKSTFIQSVKEEIVSILKETEQGAVQVKKDTNPADIKKITDSGLDVELKESNTGWKKTAIKTVLYVLQDESYQGNNDEGEEMAEMIVNALDKKGFFGRDEIDESKNPDNDENEDKEPSKSDIKKEDGLAKTKSKLVNLNKELKQVTSDMRDMAKQYQKAEGQKKTDLMNSLKTKTKAKKELETQIKQIESSL